MSDWIKCSERMPDQRVPVLVYGENGAASGDIAVAWWQDRRGVAWWKASGVSGYEFEFDISPTHWQPLPPPPGMMPVYSTDADGFVQDWAVLQYAPAPIFGTVTDPLEPGSVVQIADANGVPIWYRVAFCKRRPDRSVCDLCLHRLATP